MHNAVMRIPGLDPGIDPRIQATGTYFGLDRRIKSGDDEWV
jgi:hypothetical protein